MFHYDHCSHIYNSQNMERTQISPNRGMDTENVVHLHNEYYSTTKNNEFMKFIDKWMELETIFHPEFAQSQKNTQGMQSLISGY